MATVSYLPGVRPPIVHTPDVHKPVVHKPVVHTPARDEPADGEFPGNESEDNESESELSEVDTSCYDLERAAAAKRTTGDAGMPATEQRSARRAENMSMAALTRRGQSRWELENTLVSREIDPALVEAELERLEQVGLIDDAALAETVVRVGRERKGLGRTALAADLRRRHIDQEHIDAALESVDDSEESQLALEVGERRARQLRSLDHATAVRRLTGYLMRKGYNSSLVRSVVDEVLPRSGGGVRFR